ncbi:MAG: VF530 family protein [Pseudomonadota bacterium]
MNAPDTPTPEPEPPPEAPPAKPVQPRNPLHGVTLEAMVVALVDYFGWEELGQRVPVRCFQSDPSVASSLKFLRKTPWAREKVESLYLYMLRDHRRNTKE